MVFEEGAKLTVESSEYGSLKLKRNVMNTVTDKLRENYSILIQGACNTVKIVTSEPRLIPKLKQIHQMIATIMNVVTDGLSM